MTQQSPTRRRSPGANPARHLGYSNRNGKFVPGPTIPRELTKSEENIIFNAVNPATETVHKRMYPALRKKLNLAQDDLFYHLMRLGVHHFRKDFAAGIKDVIPLDHESTAFAPGTVDKIEILRKRAERGVALFHPEDNPLPVINDLAFQYRIEEYKHRGD